MTKIKSLYDAVIKTQVKEDKCTNFLLWLLRKLPSRVLLEICKISDLSISDKRTDFDFQVQYTLDNSRADALITFSEFNHILIETKRFPSSFDRDQFTNHLKSGQNEFGKENVWFLFLSGDEHIPSELEKLKNENKGKIGFISWKALLQLLKGKKDALGEKYEIIIEEFLTFANHYKLGRLVSMDNEELNKFMEAYPNVAKYEYAVEEKLSTILDKLKNRIILECEELVEENKDEETKQLPCPYKSLNIKEWHIKKSSSYIFIDLLTKNIGILLNGYQDESEKVKFMQLWNEGYKNKYKEDSSLKAFTFILEEDEDNDIYGEYFKLVDGTSGKLFNPNQISELADYFYWGYVYELDSEKLDSYYEIIPTDFKKLLNTFLKHDTSIKNPKNRAKARSRIRKGN